MNLSVSGLSRVSSCKRAIAFYAKAALRKPTRTFHLAIGTGFHAYADAYYSGKEQLVAEFLAEKAFRASIPDDMEETAIIEGEAILNSLCASYPDLAKPLDERDQISPIAVEQVFNIEFGKARLIGRIDLYAGCRFGMAVEDHKTAGSAKASYFWDYWRDPQAVLYPHVARVLNLPCNAFAANVIAKTKEPYLSREWYPVNWRYIDWAVGNLVETINEWADFPEEPAKILKLPANPCHCRKCSYVDLCDNPGKVDWIASNYFVLADHSDFEKKGIGEEDE